MSKTDTADLGLGPIANGDEENARGRLQRGRRDIKVQHLHMRHGRHDDDMGTVHILCKPTAKTGFPVTAMMF